MISWEQKLEIIRLKSTGISNAKIGKLFGITSWTVIYHLRSPDKHPILKRKKGDHGLIQKQCDLISCAKIFISERKNQMFCSRECYLIFKNQHNIVSPFTGNPIKRKTTEPKMYTEYVRESLEREKKKNLKKNP